MMDLFINITYCKRLIHKHVNRKEFFFFSPHLCIFQWAMRQKLPQSFLKGPGGGKVRGCRSGQADVPAVQGATPNQQPHCPRAVSEVRCTWYWGGLHQYFVCFGGTKKVLGKHLLYLFWLVCFLTVFLRKMSSVAKFLVCLAFYLR